jgi:hypothetical protein
MERAGGRGVVAGVEQLVTDEGGGWRGARALVEAKFRLCPLCCVLCASAGLVAPGPRLAPCIARVHPPVAP